MKIACALIILTLALAGCQGMQAPAVIADLTPDKAVIQSGLGTTDGDIAQKALEACKIHGWKLPKKLSYTCLDEYCIEKNIFLHALSELVGM